MATVADAYRSAACGRVVAMLASKDDAPEQVVRRLANALDEPTVVPKPVIRPDVCLVMLLVGALVVLVWNHVRECVGSKDQSTSEEEGEEQTEYDDQILE